MLERDVDISLDKHAANAIDNPALPVFDKQELGDRCDLVVVVGGDGSMLSAGRTLAHYDVQVVGINRGGLGFLTDIAPDELEQKMDQVFDGDYSTEDRFLLSTRICSEVGKSNCGPALNDVVLSSGSASRMIEFELYIEDQFVYSQRSNGLIVSTPTGSTAYALSGGGPIMHPALDAIVLVPMFPHTLTSRPIVIDGNKAIRIVVGSLHDINPLVSCDGHENFTVEPGDELHINKLDDVLTLIHPNPTNYYENCRRKLGWGSKLGG